ncbi:hypothetical protein KC19_2G183700 [Ceratodon purpureus]|uniref:Uncharacterized protein n=1 Tax=Ceratodon purpureus TaxID=3225 RepID=A0A8T0IY51_CERPU|nr:hypothetical protein KC19_2G183700 [Ceratodon purpureus]
MGDPVSGAVVGLLLTEVTNAIKKAYRCKENCEKLQSTLNSVSPYVKKMADRGNDTCRKWLEDLECLLEDAKRIITKYRILEKPTLISSAFVYWKRSRVNSLILDIHHGIEKKIDEAIMLILDIVQAVHDEVMTRKSPTMETSSGFVLQDLPANIVSFENDTYGKLKTLIKTEGDGMGDPVTIGLRGAGGAGKTLLAKMLHNDPDIQAKYGAHSILWITIGQDATLSSLYLTMGKLLKDDVFEREYASRNEEDQRTYLIDAFKKKKVLLILDDVWEQYSHGHSMMEWLDVAKGLGSVTLVTTRNSAVLTSAKAKETVVVPLLSESEGWKLFCYQTFGAGPPQGQIAKIAKDICKECHGLPLALAVIGGTMYDEKKLSQWRSALSNLKQSKRASIPLEERLFHRLKFSYDKLDDVKKKCFLYFAAFPEDYQISTHQLCSIWQAEHLFGDWNEAEEASNDGVATLISLADQSLIELSKNGKIAKMHDVLRDLAIRIIHEAKPTDWASECYFEPGKDLKTIPKFSSTIKRISLISSRIQDLPENLLMPQLQVLLLSNFNIGNNENNTPLKFSQIFFRGLNNLLYIDLSSIPLIELPESIKELKALTSLNLSGCSSLKELPENIKELKALTSLDLSWCSSLKELPESIKELKALTSLNLRRCSSLKELPESIKELKALTSLDLSGCSSLKELPESIKELKALTSLNLSGCSSLKELPESIKELKALTSLNLRRCSSLKELPESIKELKALTSLDLSWCSSLKELPESIKELKALTSLNLSGCSSLKELPESIKELKALTSLNLSWCSSLKELPESIKELKALTSLDLSWCLSLKELPESIKELKALTSLDLSRCSSLKELPENIRS